MPGLSTATICNPNCDAAACQTPTSALLLGQPWWYNTVAAGDDAVFREVLRAAGALCCCVAAWSGNCMLC